MAPTGGRKNKEQAMRARDGIISIITLALALAAGAGSVWSDPYPAALKAEAAGFDALAHGVFGALAPAPQPERSS
jgi:hypothetical protein